MNALTRRPFAALSIFAALGLPLAACAADTGDAPVGTTTQADSALDAQIAAIYTTTLERTPQAWEIATWDQRITSGQATLASMRHAFVWTAECGTKIASVYTGTLERTPQTWEIDTWRNNLDTGGWSIKSMRHAFTQTAECGAKIVQVYQDTLHRTPATCEIDTWRNNLDVNGWTIAKMRAAFEQQASAPGKCQPGGDGYLTVSGFTGDWGNTNLVIGNYVTFEVTLGRAGAHGPVTVQIDDYPSFTWYLDAPQQYRWIMPGAPRWTASSPTHHTIGVKDECGTVTQSFDGALVHPTVPQATLYATPTYVTVGSAVTLMPNDQSFAFPNCDTQTYTIVGTLAGTNAPAFKATGVTGSITVHPTADTYYTATNECALASVHPGTPTSTTSSRALVTIGPSSTPSHYYCFTVTTPGSAAMPPTCWAEAVPAPDEATAESIEKGRNQNATVDALGECTSVPTGACE